MPLVRIEFMKGKPAHFGSRVGEIVYQAMHSTIAIPANDHFQVITEHDHDSLIYDPTYLDIERTDGFLVIQITLNEGRTLQAKKALYQEIAERLHEALGIRKEDVFINLIEVKKENWSFGSGIAQYAQS
jgi:phenylpyruvate tautomerase PptA (4-oxalocrotonate tautomerase family)